MRALVAGVIVVATLSSCFYDVPPVADSIGDDAGADATMMMTDAGPCTCVPAFPAGWSLAIFDPDMQPACPSGWGASTDWITNPTAPASTCACTCGAPSGQPLCDATANFTVQFGTTNQCAGPMGVLSVANTCTSTATTFPSNQPLGFVKATTNLVPTGGACGAGTATQTIPPSTFSKGRSCAGKAIGTCNNKDQCVPVVPAPFQTCISKDGDNPCPPAFPKKTLGGASVTDTRACGPSACTCAITGTCDPPNLHLYTVSACNLNNQVASISADGTCYSTAMSIAGFTIQSARYNGTFPLNVSCASQAFMPTGTLGVANPTTFCCL